MFGIMDAYRREVHKVADERRVKDRPVVVKGKMRMASNCRIL